MRSDLAYLKAWGSAATGQSLPRPAPEALLLKFVAHHLWDSEKRACDPDHGMPADMDENLRHQGYLKSVGRMHPNFHRRSHQDTFRGSYDVMLFDTAPRAWRRSIEAIKQRAMGHFSRIPYQ